jgi:hypothetical protein
VVLCADVQKCFPTADRKVMLYELAGQGVWGHAWHLLRRMDVGDEAAGGIGAEGGGSGRDEECGYSGLRGRVMVSGELPEQHTSGREVQRARCGVSPSQAPDHWQFTAR